MTPLGIKSFTLSSALGHGLEANWHALREGRTGLKLRPFETCEIATWVGEVDGLDEPLPAEFTEWDCRTHRIVERALPCDGFAGSVGQARQRYGADRIGVFIGTSTSGVHQTELAYREVSDERPALPEWFSHRSTQNMFAPAAYVRRRLKLSGPCISISTACSSSSKVFASARRAIESGLCDAAVVGGVDSLCLTTLYGFNALQLLSPDICRPADVARCGLSIGEAAGFVLLEREAGTDGLWFEGYGESSDAHHMSAPDPTGLGAITAMREALTRADASSDSVGFVNLHGTGTLANDGAEDKAVCAVFGATTPCASTKGWTGHTLGAAGISSAVLSLICLREGFVPMSLNIQTKDPKLGGNIVLHSYAQPLRRVVTNAFGFGGTNCSLVFGRPG